MNRKTGQTQRTILKTNNTRERKSERKKIIISNYIKSQTTHTLEFKLGGLSLSHGVNKGKRSQTANSTPGHTASFSEHNCWNIIQKLQRSNS